MISGHCGVGLGGCYYAVHKAFDPAPLDDLAEHDLALKCTRGECGCSEPPPVACPGNLACRALAAAAGRAA